MDVSVAAWFHARLTPGFVSFLLILSAPGSELWTGASVACIGLFLTWKQSWYGLLTLMLNVPGGTLLNEWVKILVRRPRPYLAGPFVNWDGFGFTSGHTIAATLLYGTLVFYLAPALKVRRRQLLAAFFATLLVLSVGFSRIALGAHYLTDVMAAMALGSAWLTLCLRAVEAFRRNRVRASS